MSIPDMVTLTGTDIWFDQPWLLERSSLIRDMRYYLPRIKRYNCGMDWTLLEHLLLCRNMVESGDKFDIMLWRLCAAHDVHEIYVGDVVAGLKRFIPDYQSLELVWEHRVHELLELEPLEPGSELAVQLKRHDRRAVVLETYYMGKPIYRKMIAGGIAPITEYEKKLFSDVSLLKKDYAMTLLEETLGLSED